MPQAHVPGPGQACSTPDALPNGPPAARRMLVFSPHPDDDVISMGGTLARLCQQGYEVGKAEPQGAGHFLGRSYQILPDTHTHGKWLWPVDCLKCPVSCEP